MYRIGNWAIGSCGHRLDEDEDGLLECPACVDGDDENPDREREPDEDEEE